MHPKLRWKSIKRAGDSCWQDGFRPLDLDQYHVATDSEPHPGWAGTDLKVISVPWKDSLVLYAFHLLGHWVSAGFGLARDGPSCSFIYNIHHQKTLIPLLPSHCLQFSYSSRLQSLNSKLRVSVWYRFPWISSDSRSQAINWLPPGN